MKTNDISEKVARWLLERWGIFDEKGVYYIIRAPYWWERIIGYFFGGKEEKENER